MSAKFCVDAWAAWAPGLPSQEAWLNWFAQPSQQAFPDPEGQASTPALSEMPAMMRRRMEPLARIALQTAYQAQASDASGKGPVVFASRWGELSRSVDLLEALVAEQGLSPTSFSLSVHNAIGALYSIARGDHGNYLAVSGGEFSAEAAFVEAQALLADGAEKVLVVFFEAPLPEFLALHEPQSAGFPPYAWACQLSASQPHGLSLAPQLLAPVSAPTSMASSPLPAGLEVLRFILGRDAQLRRDAPHASWLWTRHGS